MTLFILKNKKKRKRSTIQKVIPRHSNLYNRHKPSITPESPTHKIKIIYNYKTRKCSPDDEENINIENRLQNWLKDEVFQFGENEREIFNSKQRVVVHMEQGHPQTHDGPHSRDDRHEALGFLHT